MIVVGNDATGGAANVGNLLLGSTNGIVKTFVGNIAQANVVTTVSEGLLSVNGNFIANNISSSGNLITSNSYVPSANNSVGTTGQITWDEDYVYICVAENIWKRANLSTW